MADTINRSVLETLKKDLENTLKKISDILDDKPVKKPASKKSTKKPLAGPSSAPETETASDTSEDEEKTKVKTVKAVKEPKVKPAKKSKEAKNKTVSNKTVDQEDEFTEPGDAKRLTYISLSDMENIEDKNIKKKYTLSLLKDLCQERNLPKTGTKASLVESLIVYLKKENSCQMIPIVEPTCEENNSLEQASPELQIQLRDLDGNLVVPGPNKHYVLLVAENDGEIFVEGWHPKVTSGNQFNLENICKYIPDFMCEYIESKGMYVSHNCYNENGPESAGLPEEDREKVEQLVKFMAVKKTKKTSPKV